MKKIAVVAVVVILSVSCGKNKECLLTAGSTVAPANEKSTVTSYLSSNNITNATELNGSGLYYVIDAAGNSKSPGQCSSIEIRYTGKLANGTVFDQTQGNATATFTLGQLIEGWRRGLPLIGVGGKIRLYIPASLGYGASGYYNQSTGTYIIPPNSMLIFDVDMVNVAN